VLPIGLPGVPGAVGVPGGGQEGEPGAARRSALVAGAAQSSAAAAQAEAAHAQSGYATGLGGAAGSAERQGGVRTGQVRAAARQQFLAQRAAGAEPDEPTEDDGDGDKAPEQQTAVPEQL
jgi:hypothetical protein